MPSRVANQANHTLVILGRGKGVGIYTGYDDDLGESFAHP